MFTEFAVIRMLASRSVSWLLLVSHTNFHPLLYFFGEFASELMAWIHRRLLVGTRLAPLSLLRMGQRIPLFFLFCALMVILSPPRFSLTFINGQRVCKLFPQGGMMLFRELQRRSQLEKYTVDDRRHKWLGYKRSLADSSLGRENPFMIPYSSRGICTSSYFYRNL